MDETRNRLLDTALALAVARDWSQTTMAEIAEAAEVSLLDTYRAFPNKATMIDAIMARTDEGMLEGVERPQWGESPRDRLFDLIMRRFDTLQPHKTGIRALLNAMPKDPLTLLMAGPYLLRAMTWTLEAAGFGVTSLRGIVRLQALTGIYLRTLRVWLRDETADMADTMASLDRDLRRTANFFTERGGRFGAYEGSDAAGMAWPAPVVTAPPEAGNGPVNG